MKLLTKTETKVAHGISQGLIEKELADKLCVSVHTVHAHARNIRKKLGARNMADITRMYILSLDNPKLVLRAVFFLVVQLGILWHDAQTELRKPVNRTVKVRRGRKGKTKTNFYV